MLDILIAPVSEKGQVTIPAPIRKRLGINGLVGFRVVKGKVHLVPIEVREKSPYTEEELDKIEKLARTQKGKIFDNAADAIRYVRSL